MENKIDARKNIIISTSRHEMIVNIIIAIIMYLISKLSGSLILTTNAIGTLGGAWLAYLTIRGIRQANRPPDIEHPHGYGRMEYFSSLIINATLLVLSLSIIYRAILGIINPSGHEIYKYFELLIIIVSMIIKVRLGRHAIKVSKEVKSKALKSIGSHSIKEVFSETVTLFAILLFLLFDINIANYLSIVVSLMVIYSIVISVKDTMDQLIGYQVPKDIADDIKSIITNDENVRGVFDLIIHDYGYNKKLGTCNVELSEKLSVKDAAKSTHMLQNKIYQKYEIYITFGIYSINETDPNYIMVRDLLEEECLNIDNVVGIHAFYYDITKRKSRFDVVVDFDCHNLEEKAADIKEMLKKNHQEFSFDIRVEYDLY